MALATMMVLPCGGEPGAVDEVFSVGGAVSVPVPLCAYALCCRVKAREKFGFYFTLFFVGSGF